jgi:transposase InsO family protein
MNAYIESLNGSIRREALDHFLLFSGKQILKIVTSYVNYYNHYRSHQGIGIIPHPQQHYGLGKIRKEPVMGGLHHTYYRNNA